MGSRVSRGKRNIAWIERYCRVPEGKFVGKPVKLRPWQRKEIIKIYDNPAGTRLAILSFGRKNGKTALSAFLLLLHLCGPEAIRNSQLLSAAQSRDQAALLFSLAAKCARLSPALAEVLNIRDTAKEILCGELGTLYKALSAEASTAYGKSPVFIVHDELGQVRGPRSELYDALETATGAQENPLSIIISTQAPSDGDLFSMLIDDALTGADPRTTCTLYTTIDRDNDPDYDPFSEDAIKEANPAYGDFLNPVEVMTMAQAAARMPSREPEFRNLILNQRVQAGSPFCSKSVWKGCVGEVAEDWGSAPVYGGLDLASVNDLASLVLIAPIGGAWHVRSQFWLPEVGIVEKSKAERTSYDLWANQGYITLTPGKTIEYEYIAKHLWDLFQDLNVLNVAFDRWNFKHLKPWLKKCGFTDDEIEERFTEFGQGFQSMSPALRTLEADLINGAIVHDDNPVLRMCAANAVVQSDPAGNRKLAKNKSSGKIDGMISLTMARAVAETAEQDTEPEYKLLIL